MTNTILFQFQGNYQGVDEDHWLTSTLPAGGWLDLVGGGSTRTPISVRVYEANGNSYNPEVQIDTKGILLT